MHASARAINYWFKFGITMSTEFSFKRRIFVDGVSCFFRLSCKMMCVHMLTHLLGRKRIKLCIKFLTKIKTHLSIFIRIRCRNWKFVTRQHEWQKSHWKPIIISSKFDEKKIINMSDGTFRCVGLNVADNKVHKCYSARLESNWQNTKRKKKNTTKMLCEQEI